MEEQDKQPRIKWLKKLERGEVTREAEIDGTRGQYHDTVDLPYDLPNKENRE
jgi:hypothetical protein